jgi:hypothetical protein
MLEMKLRTQLIRKKEKKREKGREREGGRGGLGDVFLIFTEYLI